MSPFSTTLLIYPASKMIYPVREGINHTYHHQLVVVVAFSYNIYSYSPGAEVGWANSNSTINMCSLLYVL